MKKIATSAVFVALVVASVAPAAAATSRPKAATVDAAVLATTVPVTFAATDTSSTITSAAAKVPTPVFTDLNSGLLAYFKADMSFQGAVYQDLVDHGMDTTALTKSFGQLDAVLAGLIDYLDKVVSKG
jgi:hypothetical protein